MKSIAEFSGFAPEGFPYIVLLNLYTGCRNGYVGVDSSHPCYKKAYSVIDDGNLSNSVHGGLTYSGFLNGEILGADNIWYFGFDCNHLDDAPISVNEFIDIVRKHMGKKDAEYLITRYKMMFATNQHFFTMIISESNTKTLDFVRGNCFDLIKELAKMQSSSEYQKTL